MEADDGHGESNSVGTFTVTVTVTNVDETPKITTTGASHATPALDEIEYDAESADLDVVTYAATRRGGRSHHLVAERGRRRRLHDRRRQRPAQLPQPARLRRPAVVRPPLRETTRTTTYEIVVEATDASTSTGNTARNTREFPVTVTVTDVDETPEVSGPARQPRLSLRSPYDSDADAARCRHLHRPRPGDVRTSPPGPSAETMRTSSPSRGTPSPPSPPSSPSSTRPTSRIRRTRTKTESTSSPWRHPTATNTGTRDYAVTVTDVKRGARVHRNYRNDVYRGRARRERGLPDTEDRPDLLQRARRRRRGDVVADRHGQRATSKSTAMASSPSPTEPSL